MTEEHFIELMACLGFGFGTIFWFGLLWLVFGWRGK